MQGLWWKLPVLRGLGPARKGIAEAVQVVLGVAFLFAGLLLFLDFRPSSGLLLSLGQIGATLLVAYVLEVSWIIRAGRKRPLEERENRLGTFVGIGTAGLLGIAVSLVLVERVIAHHWTWLDDLAFGWALASLFMLGVTVVMQPWVIHEWLDESESA